MFRTAILWLCFFAFGAGAESPRRVISLNGIWQIEEGGFAEPPRVFTHKVAVPGLVSHAAPSFVPSPRVTDENDYAFKDPLRDAFWYRRTFHVDQISSVARLKIHKAMFGAKVILNGVDLGEHQPSFTPGEFDARQALRAGENELLIRVGADRAAVTKALPSGQDFEKSRYIPGIFDSIELIMSGTPNILNVQAAPQPDLKSVRVQVHLENGGPPRDALVRFVLREWRTGTRVSETTVTSHFNSNSVGVVDVRIGIPHARLWSPEDPFLYTVEVDTGSDRTTSRFGMRTFRFDPVAGRAVLNGKPYYMRGSNITLYRFFEDEASGTLPWNQTWVRELHRRVKDMHWNSLRYCIGFPPERWYEIADEEGILIQDEFPIWYMGGWPQELKRDELTIEFFEWMRERWNHPSVVIWDASNETESTETGPAIQSVRALDLSNRPWDNSYSVPLEPGDVLESHPYHFQDSNFKLSDLATADPVPDGNVVVNDGKHAVIINEYGWLWLNRDGTPTTLTQDLYKNLLGPTSTKEQRRELYARYLAAETEFWRAHRRAAAVMHFTALGYSRADGQTSDHWLDVAKLVWEPKFYSYVRDAFAPTGLMIDAWAAKYSADARQEFPVLVVNDRPAIWEGLLRFRLIRDGEVLHERTRPLTIEALGTGRSDFKVRLPRRRGRYRIEAALIRAGEPPVTSLRDFEI